MRVVWIVLALLLLAGAAAVWNAMNADDVDAQALREAERAAALPSGAPADGPHQSPRAGPRVDGPHPDGTRIDGTRIDGPPSGPGASTAAASPATPTAPAPPPPHSAAAPQAGPGTALDLAKGLAEELARSADARGTGGTGATGGASSTTTGTPSSPPSSRPAALPVGEPLLDGLDVRIPSATVVPGNIRELADGSIGADDRFVIRGAGTAEDPYIVTWDLLVSASETYQPRQGRKEIPQRVAMLSGKHVRIQGYAAFPAFSFDPTDMLMMLNRWDGCCIGVPPTPFDAIEVKLSVVPKDNRRMVAYFGSVEGKLTVEPYLADSWLVGLYVMSDARFRLDL